MELNVCLKSSSVWKYFSGSKPSSHSELHTGSCSCILSQKSTPQTDAHVSWPSACMPICSDYMCSLASCLDSFLTVSVPSNGDLISSLNVASLSGGKLLPMSRAETPSRWAHSVQKAACAKESKCQSRRRKGYDHSTQALVDGPKQQVLCKPIKNILYISEELKPTGW